MWIRTAQGSLINFHYVDEVFVSNDLGKFYVRVRVVRHHLNLLQHFIDIGNYDTKDKADSVVSRIQEGLIEEDRVLDLISDLE